MVLPRSSCAAKLAAVQVMDGIIDGFDRSSARPAEELR